MRKIKKLFIVLAILPLYVNAQDGDYCVSSAVEEKLEITAYYPTTFAFIGQFWDTSHSHFNFRTRQNVWAEPAIKSGFGFVSAEIGLKDIFGLKNLPIYPGIQARFNSHTAIWAGINGYISDIHLKKPLFKKPPFYQLQIGTYVNLYAKDEYLLSGYFQTRSFSLGPLLKKKKLFFEGFGNYYTLSKDYNFEIEAGFKLSHYLAVMAGFEHFEKKGHAMAGIRLELYEHKNQKKKL